MTVPGRWVPKIRKNASDPTATAPRPIFRGAKSILSSDLDLDNTMLLRCRVEKQGWKPRWNTKPEIDNTCLFAPAPGCRP
jgi:hypothetical protein